MKISNAITKLEKAGFTITQDFQVYSAKKEGFSGYLTFSPNDPKSPEPSFDGVLIDHYYKSYFTSSYFANLKRAMACYLTK